MFFGAFVSVFVCVPSQRAHETFKPLAFSIVILPIGYFCLLLWLESHDLYH